MLKPVILVIGTTHGFQYVRRPLETFIKSKDYECTFILPDQMERVEYSGYRPIPHFDMIVYIIASSSGSHGHNRSTVDSQQHIKTACMQGRQAIIFVIKEVQEEYKNVYLKNKSNPDIVYHHADSVQTHHFLAEMHAFDNKKLIRIYAKPGDIISHLKKTWDETPNSNLHFPIIHQSMTDLHQKVSDLSIHYQQLKEEIETLKAQQNNRSANKKAQPQERMEQAIAKSVKGAKQVLSFGIKDAFIGHDLKKTLAQCRNTDIIIQRLYLSKQEFDILKTRIIELINADCRISVLLLSPEKYGVLEDRYDNCKPYQPSIGLTPTDMRKLIRQESETILDIIAALPDAQKDRLQLRWHSDLAVAAITGFADELIVSSYMHETTADNGLQLMFKGVDTNFYQVYARQFFSHWHHAVVVTKDLLNRDSFGFGTSTPD